MGRDRGMVREPAPAGAVRIWLGFRDMANGDIGNLCGASAMRKRYEQC